MSTPAKPADKPNMEQRVADLEAQLAQTRAGLPGGTLPDHSGGYADEIEETWSQAEQERARAEADGMVLSPHPAPADKPGQGPK